MEQNTVILPLAEYNRLRDFENKILGGEVIFINSYRKDSYEIISKDETIKILAKENEIMKKFADSTVDKHNELIDVKKMSWREFIKWRRR